MKITKTLLALLLCAVMLFSLAGCSAPALFKRYNDYKTISISSWTNGDYYLTTPGGKQIMLSGEGYAVISDDQKTAVTVNTDTHTARLLNIKSGKSEDISFEAGGEVADLLCVAIYHDIAIFGVEFYTDAARRNSTYEIWFYSVKTKECALRLQDEKTASDLDDILEQIGQFAYGQDQNSIRSLAYIKDNTIYSYVLGEKETTELCSLNRLVTTTLQYVSADGRTVLFAEEADEQTVHSYSSGLYASGTTTDSLWLCYNQNLLKIHSLTHGKNEYLVFDACASLDGSLMAIFIDQKLFIVKEGAILVENECRSISTLAGMSVYTDNGPLSEEKDEVDGVYASIKDDKKALYYWDAAGNKTTVAENVDGYRIQNGRIAYVQNGMLCVGRVKKGVLSDVVKLTAKMSAAGWADYTFSPDGKYLYYCNSDDALYAYRCGDAEAKFVSEQVDRYYVALNGKSVVYLTAASEAGSVLKHYKFRSEKHVNIAEEVLSPVLPVLYPRH